jgi:hypothetical protein
MFPGPKLIGGLRFGIREPRKSRAWSTDWFVWPSMAIRHPGLLRPVIFPIPIPLITVRIILSGPIKREMSFTKAILCVSVAPYTTSMILIASKGVKEPAAITLKRKKKRLAW